MGPVPDPERLLSGHPQEDTLPAIDKNVLGEWVLFNGSSTVAVGPWGATFAANLTSDATGIGNWTFEHFKTALTKGKYKGMENSRSLLPPMPWQNYVNMSDEDLKAVFAYLKSTKPVRNIVHAPISADDLPIK